MSVSPLEPQQRQALASGRPSTCPTSELELTTERLRTWAGNVMRFRAGRPDLEDLDDRAVLAILGLPDHLSAQVIDYIASGEADSQGEPA